MKNTVSKLLCIALILCMVMSFAACGLIQGLMYAGTYTLTSAEIGGQEFDASSLSYIGMDPDDCYIKLEADGTAEVNLFGEKADMEWEGNEIWLESDPDDKQEFEIDGKDLILAIGTEKRVFTKE